MPMVSNLTVLAPNGRRQNVKVNENTTVLQVLEEVSAKQGFDSKEYDLRHHNHILDTTITMRFSGLPNNALLEMAKTSKIRKESEVLVSLQCESGSRLTDKFQPSDSLWDVIIKLCPDEKECSMHPVVVYMRQEIPGMQKLKETTLRSLGLISGGAMMRFIHRSENTIPHQANVSSLLPARPVVNSVQPRYKPPPCMSLGSLAEKSNPQSNIRSSIKPTDSVAVNEMQDDKPHAANMDIDVDPFEQSEKSLENESPGQDSVMSVDPTSHVIYNSTSTEQDESMKELTEDIVLLGERNAIAFSLSMAQAVPCEDLPEDFFDLTSEDIRALFRDLKEKRAQMEEAPLQTAALRELEESKRVLSQLNKYKRVVLRIQFPDRTVLQGTFKPLETIATVCEFVRGYLNNPQTSFHLYTTPPKVILQPSDRLVDAKCVPSAVLHFGTDDLPINETNYLREDVLSQFTSPEAASIAACQSRGLLPSVSCGSRFKIEHTEKNGNAKPGTSGLSNMARNGNQRSEGGPSTKVPKWFKPTAK